ncbi:MAG: acyltransferase family protein [Deltaproteobacteria bacterium]|nr:acyltransferase family protein [Deltaproteobacteria bacterium]
MTLRDVGRLVLQSTSPSGLAARLDALDRSNLNEFGVDPFGFSPEETKLYAGPAWWLYKHYFRVEQTGVENVPDGRVLLVANHGGQLPLDGAMIIMSILGERPVPRLGRAMVEHWAAELPFVGTWFARCGQVIGDPESCKRLLLADEAVLVFPEGSKGINKMWNQIYRLREFGLGFMRQALETHTPIVPVAVVGHEEQSLALFDLKPVARLLGMPALPVTLTGLPLPLPTKYHIEFGAPMHFEGDHNDEDDVVGRKVALVRETLQRMVKDGLKRRGKRIFR